jgi:hypothetical protein
MFPILCTKNKVFEARDLPVEPFQRNGRKDFSATIATCMCQATRQGENLDRWLAQATEESIAELRSFVENLRKDYQAVKAGASLEWSNGQTKAKYQCGENERSYQPCSRYLQFMC